MLFKFIFVQRFSGLWLNENFMVKELQYNVIVSNLTVVIIKYLFVSLNNFLKSLLS